jgi:hypothetical protein
MNKDVFWTMVWPFVVFGAAAAVAGGYGLHLMQQACKRHTHERQTQEPERRAGPDR